MTDYQQVIIGSFFEYLSLYQYHSYVNVTVDVTDAVESKKSRQDLAFLAFSNRRTLLLVPKVQQKNQRTKITTYTVAWKHRANAPRLMEMHNVIYDIATKSNINNVQHFFAM